MYSHLEQEPSQGIEPHGNQVRRRQELARLLGLVHAPPPRLFGRDPSGSLLRGCTAEDTSWHEGSKEMDKKGCVVVGVCVWSVWGWEGGGCLLVGLAHSHGLRLLECATASSAAAHSATRCLTQSPS